MANHPTRNSEPAGLWPATFAEVEEPQRRRALAATPAQRLAWAEELIELARLAADARAAPEQESG